MQGEERERENAFIIGRVAREKLSCVENKNNRNESYSKVHLSAVDGHGMFPSSKLMKFQ